MKGVGRGMGRGEERRREESFDASEFFGYYNVMTL